MFLLFRLFGNSTPARIRWLIVALVLAASLFGVVFGLVNHNGIIELRGILGVVLGALFAARSWRAGRSPARGGPPRGSAL